MGAGGASEVPLAASRRIIFLAVDHLLPLARIGAEPLLTGAPAAAD
jgi:hypothetical protein